MKRLLVAASIVTGLVLFGGVSAYAAFAIFQIHGSGGGGGGSDALPMGVP